MSNPSVQRNVPSAKSQDNEDISIPASTIASNVMPKANEDQNSAVQEK